MQSIAKVGCAFILACSLAGPASAAQGDAGSGPTTGATSTNDAGSGPTKGSTPKPETQKGNSDAGSSNSAGATPGPSSTGGAQPVTPGGASKQ
jgi:hypothetical protein